LDSLLVHGYQASDGYRGSISFPIFQTATFQHPGLNQSIGYDYSRSENPTREQLEKTIALLEEGRGGFAFSSGMAAISTVMELFSPGDHIIVSEDLYGGTYRLFEEIQKKRGLEFSYIDSSIQANLECSLQPNTQGIFIETPTNPMMRVTDIRAAAELAAAHGIKLIVDNTFLTPYYQRPLTLGADLVVHSATKYLGGHNDTLAGLVAVKDDETAERIKNIQRSVGAVLAPFDSWLILRGIKTLAVRMDKQQSNALQIADWLDNDPRVEKVYYVGLPEHPGHAVCSRQSSGFGGMISFAVRDQKRVEAILKNVKLLSFAESLGGVESLITYPFLQTHAAIPACIRCRLGVDEKLLRLSVGIENSLDIIADLDQALG
jgi:cystathionine gamma-synthase